MIPFFNQKLKEVFEDTQKQIRETPALKEAQKKSIRTTVFYGENDYPALPVPASFAELDAMAYRTTGEASPETAPVRKRQEIRVTKYRTYESAMKLHAEYPEKKIAVLNFASAVNPGGGVLRGAGAQEECLCRCSTLYDVLNQDPLWDAYYTVNRKKHDPLYSDACIYSPDIVICKSDEDLPKRLEPEDFVSVDVITCAAPDLREAEGKYSDAELYEIFCRRIGHILHVAAANGAELLVLGAFGCGAFRNDPQLVSKAFRFVMIDYLDRFDVVEFAVFCREYETANYDAFMKNLSCFPKHGIHRFQTGPREL